jgi:hypothetical protein
MLMLDPEDQQDKVVKIRRLAQEVERAGADTVLITTEASFALELDALLDVMWKLLDDEGSREGSVNVRGVGVVGFAGVAVGLQKGPHPRGPFAVLRRADAARIPHRAHVGAASHAGTRTYFRSASARSVGPVPADDARSPQRSAPAASSLPTNQR